MQDNLSFSPSILRRLFYYQKLMMRKGLKSSVQHVFLMFAFTKVGIARLNSAVDYVVRPTQTAFMLGRYILDGVVMLHEIIHELHQKNKMG
jgi:hypothetical protein